MAPEDAAAEPSSGGDAQAEAENPPPGMRDAGGDAPPGTSGGESLQSTMEGEESFWDPENPHRAGTAHLSPGRRQLSTTALARHKVHAPRGFVSNTVKKKADDALKREIRRRMPSQPK